MSFKITIDRTNMNGYNKTKQNNNELLERKLIKLTLVLIQDRNGEFCTFFE